MALARVKTWIAGEILTAADLNGEFNNVLNNPISLISPLTANLNINGKQLTNLALESLGASPAAGTAGRVWFNTATSVKQVEVDDGTFIRTLPTVLATSLTPGDILYAVAGSSQGGNPSWTRLGNAASSFLNSVLVSGTSGPIWSAPGSGTPTGVAQAWVVFAGNTTSSQAAVLAAFNVTTSIGTIIKNSSGDFTIPWMNQFTTVNYPVIGMCSNATESAGLAIVANMTSSGNSTSAARVITKDGQTSSLRNPVTVQIVAYGAV